MAWTRLGCMIFMPVLLLIIFHVCTTYKSTSVQGRRDHDLAGKSYLNKGYLTTKFVAPKQRQLNHHYNLTTKVISYPQCTEMLKASGGIDVFKNDYEPLCTKQNIDLL